MTPYTQLWSRFPLILLFSSFLKERSQHPGTDRKQDFPWRTKKCPTPDGPRIPLTTKCGRLAPPTAENLPPLFTETYPPLFPYQPGTNALPFFLNPPVCLQTFMSLNPFSTVYCYWFIKKICFFFPKFFFFPHLWLLYPPLMSFSSPLLTFDHRTNCSGATVTPSRQRGKRCSFRSYWLTDRQDEHGARHTPPHLFLNLVTRNPRGKYMFPESWVIGGGDIPRLYTYVWVPNPFTFSVVLFWEKHKYPGVSLLLFSPTPFLFNWFYWPIPILCIGTQERPPLGVFKFPENVEARILLLFSLFPLSHLIPPFLLNAESSI